MILQEYLNDKSYRNTEALYNHIIKIARVVSSSTKRKHNLKLSTQDLEDIVSKIMMIIIELVDNNKFDARPETFDGYIVTCTRHETNNYAKSTYKFTVTESIWNKIESTSDTRELEDNNIYLSADSLPQIIDSFVERYPNKKQAVDAMLMIFNRGNRTQYVIDNNIDQTTMRTRAHQGRKFIRQYIQNELYPGKKITRLS